MRTHDGVSWRTMCRDDDRKRARTDDDRGGHHRKQRAGSCSSATSGDSEERQERSERHYMLRVGDEFDGGRYRVVSQLGKGTFGRVVEMVDTATGRRTRSPRASAFRPTRAPTRYRTPRSA